MAITLVMMAAVVTLFANVSNSVRNRRATIEMTQPDAARAQRAAAGPAGGDLPGRHLAAARIEPRVHRADRRAVSRRRMRRNLIDGDRFEPTNPNWPPTIHNPEIDHEHVDRCRRAICRSRIRAQHGRPTAAGWATTTTFSCSRCATSTSRLSGGCRRTCDDVISDGDPMSIFSELGLRDDRIAAGGGGLVRDRESGYTDDAQRPDGNRFFGEPGMRTIYRRTLLIAPWLNPYRYVDQTNGNAIDTFTYDGDNFKAEPGLVRMLPEHDHADVEEAIAAIIAFQDRYDLSVRLEWDHNIQRWKIMANTLGDLTKRENRFGHYGFMSDSSGRIRQRDVSRIALMSAGSGYYGKHSRCDVCDRSGSWPAAGASARRRRRTSCRRRCGRVVFDRSRELHGLRQRRYTARPFAYRRQDAATCRPRRRRC